MKCEQCGKSFRSSAKLSSHVTIAHSGNQTCEVCHKSFGHIIFTHLEDFIERQQRPLGEFSEQVVKACHQICKIINNFDIVSLKIFGNGGVKIIGSSLNSGALGRSFVIAGGPVIPYQQ